MEDLNSPVSNYSRVDLKGMGHRHNQSITELCYVKPPTHLSTLGNRSSVYHNILSGELNTISHRLELRP